MSLSDLFKKKPREEEEERAPGNPTTMILFRVLAVGYVLWILKDLVQAYIAGGEEAPSLGLLIGTIVVFGAGIAFIVVTSIQQWKRMKTEYDDYNERVAAEYAAQEAAEAAAQEDPADDEPVLELPETEEPEDSEEE